MSELSEHLDKMTGVDLINLAWVVRDLRDGALNPESRALTEYLGREIGDAVKRHDAALPPDPERDAFIEATSRIDPADLARVVMDLLDRPPESIALTEHSGREIGHAVKRHNATLPPDPERDALIKAISGYLDIKDGDGESVTEAS